MARKDVLLVMNPQKCYFHKDGALYLGDSTASNLLHGILDRLVTIDLGSTEIILTRDLRSMEDDFHRGQTSKNFVGSPDIDIMEEMRPYAKKIINAARPSALSGTGLAAMLKTLSPTKITVVGAETQSAILFTCMDLRLNGYNVFVVENLVGSRDSFLHQCGITILSAEVGAHVI